MTSITLVKEERWHGRAAVSDQSSLTEKWRQLEGDFFCRWIPNPLTMRIARLNLARAELKKIHTILRSLLQTDLQNKF
jgi:hypothetical protein